MELCGLHDSDEHEDKTSPSEENLYEPTRRNGWEGGQFSSAAIAHIPKYISSWGTARAWFPIGPLGRLRGPWGVGEPRWVLGFGKIESLVGITAKFPRTNDENPHWLDVDHNGCNQGEQCGHVNL